MVELVGDPAREEIDRITHWATTFPQREQEIGEGYLISRKLKVHKDGIDWNPGAEQPGGMSIGTAAIVPDIEYQLLTIHSGYFADRGTPEGAAIELRGTSDTGSGPSRIELRADEIALTGGLDVEGGRLWFDDRHDWFPVTFENGWANYSTGPKPAFTQCQWRKIGDVVQLRGLASGSNSTASTITTLDPELRPPMDLIFDVEDAGGHRRLNVRADGQVQMQGTGTPGYLTLSGVSWATTDDGFTEITLETGWSPYGGNWQVPRYRVESGGLVRVEGLAAGSASATSLMANLASWSGRHRIFPADQTNNSHGRIDVEVGGDLRKYGGTDISYVSLSNIRYSDLGSDGGWRASTLQNGWANYTQSDLFHDLEMRGEADGMRSMRGLLNPSGAANVRIVDDPDRVPISRRPPGSEVFATDRSSVAHGRLDVLAGGRVQAATGGSYLSLDPMFWHGGT